jgi:pimeloyl-ACP methyl ester carboxylesterase
VSESVDQPTDVLTVQQDGGRIYTQFMDYSHWNPTLNGYIYNYSAAVPAGYDGGSAYPLMIEPHAHGENPKFRTESEFDWQVIQLFPYDPGSAAGTIHSWWYGYSADHDYRAGGSPTGGTIENFTEQRVMRAVQSLLSDPFYNIDDTLIHAYGNSMGASGSVSLALRYPSVLSGVYASQPMMDYRDSPTFFDDEFVPLWGDIENNVNLPIVNRGPFDDDISFYGQTGVQPVGVWDWMDHHKQLVDRRGDDFAFLMISHGDQDGVIDWVTQGEPTIDALKLANGGFTLVNNNQGHTWAGFDAVLGNLFQVGLGDWTYPVDLSFPAIQNAGSERFERVEPDLSLFIADNYNLDFQWATEQNLIGEPIVDTQDRYEITIVSTSTQKTVDITPRRTQSFRIDPGVQCDWTATNLNDNSTVSGDVDVDLDSLVTVKDVSIATNAGTRLVIECP